MVKWNVVFGDSTVARRIIMSDFYKVKINEEDEDDESGETRVGRFEYEEWE